MSNSTILIVDDEEDILDFIGFNLTREKYLVNTAKDGLDAIQKIEKSVPDLILLDIMMPRMNGIDFFKWLRNNPDYNSVSVLFLTAKKDEESEVTALDLGADDFINKPVKLSILVSRIKAILRRKQTSKYSADISDELIFDYLTINKRKMEVVFKNLKLELARKEFQLLYLLASQPGKVFRRAEILEEIWGKSIIVGDRTIDVHIRKLREKLDNSFIKTIKGVGYKFEI